MKELGASGSITIGAPINDVWNAITSPELIKQWFFGVDTESDWKPGSHLIHRGEWQLTIGVDGFPEAIPPPWVDPKQRSIRHSRYPPRPG